MCRVCRCVNSQPCTSVSSSSSDDGQLTGAGRSGSARQRSMSSSRCVSCPSTGRYTYRLKPLQEAAPLTGSSTTFRPTSTSGEHTCLLLTLSPGEPDQSRARADSAVTLSSSSPRKSSSPTSARPSGCPRSSLAGAS
jgi:hypothetical protein